MFNTDSLDILVVSCQRPGISLGAQQRLTAIVRALAMVGNAHLVHVAADIAPRISDNHPFVTEVTHALEVPSRRSFRDRARHELDSRCIDTVPFCVSAVDCAKMKARVDAFDVVWIHTIRAANVFGIYRWPKSVLDIDDLPSSLYSSMAREATGWLKRLAFARMAAIWRRREKRLAERFDVLTVCSAADRRRLGRASDVRVIPNGYEPAAPPPPRNPRLPPSVGFIGTFNWEPNRQGVEWLVSKVWPLVRRKIPDARLRLVGSGGSEGFNQPSAGVDALGWVEDPAVEIAGWAGMVVPIRIGGGTRIKIVEAFARKCPVVSTTLGAYGYDLQHGDKILLADSAADFARECLKLLTDFEYGRALAERAHAEYSRRWTWSAITPAIHEVVARVTQASARPGGEGPRYLWQKTTGGATRVSS
jgi:glycosyltransferase involved in cell wall biosynthesis